MSEPFAPRRFTRSPEYIELDGKPADYTHPRAVAFSLVNGKVLTTSRTHPFLFNALTTLALPERANEVACGVLARLGVEAFLLDCGVEVWPGPLTEGDLRWFRAEHTGDVGQMRKRTCSGRVWREVEDRGHKVTVFSFWVPAATVSVGVVRRLCERFSLDGSPPVYVEYNDSP